MTATLADGHRADVVTVEVGGEHLPAGSERADAALGAYLGRAVHLSHEVPATARLHRLLPSEPGLVPEWATGLPGQELTTRIDGAQPGGRFVDFGAVHLVTSGELTALARRLGRSCVPASRFRPNLVLDAPADPEPGQELSIGDVVLRVLVPTPRCVVPGLVGGSHAPDRGSAPLPCGSLSARRRGPRASCLFRHVRRGAGTGARPGRRRRPLGPAGTWRPRSFVRASRRDAGRLRSPHPPTDARVPPARPGGTLLTGTDLGRGGAGRPSEATCRGGRTAGQAAANNSSATLSGSRNSSTWPAPMFLISS